MLEGQLDRKGGAVASITGAEDALGGFEWLISIWVFPNINEPMKIS